MNYEEFKAELDKDPVLIDSIYDNHGDGFTKHLTDKKGMFVGTMDEYTRNTQTSINEAVRKNHEGYETKIEKLTGIKKNAGESGHDYFDRVSAKLKYLEDGDTPESATVKGLRTELTTLRTEIDTERKNAFKATVNAQVSGALNALTFAVPPHLRKDDEIAAFQKSQRTQKGIVFNATYSAKSENGGLVYVNGKGEAQMENGEPMTADQIVARDFASELTTSTHSQGGSGSGKNDPNSKNEGYLGPDQKTIEEKLSEMGKAYMTPEWEELFRKAMKAIGK
jgi:hypothetical protein